MASDDVGLSLISLIIIPNTKRHPNFTKTDQLPISEVSTGLPRPYHNTSPPWWAAYAEIWEIRETPVPPTRPWVEDAAPRNPLPHLWTAWLWSQENAKKGNWRKRSHYNKANVRWLGGDTVSPCRSAYFASPWCLLTLNLRRRRREAALLIPESWWHLTMWALAHLVSL